MDALLSAARLAALPRVRWACDDWPEAARADVVPVPWPVLLGWTEVPRSDATWRARFATAPVEHVPLAGLWATSGGVRRATVAAWLHTPDLCGHGPGRALNWLGVPDVPWILRCDGRAVIYDGHHRLTAAVYRGDATAAARVLTVGA